MTQAAERHADCLPLVDHALHCVEVNEYQPSAGNQIRLEIGQYGYGEQILRYVDRLHFIRNQILNGPNSESP
jgi:hypothetical protein